MNEIMKFDFKGASVRTIESNGEQWWIASDVCEVLDFKNPRSSIALLDDDEKGVHSMDTLGGMQSMTMVNESGLYSLILRSRKPQAKEFKRWITHEVLPAIRKNGGYINPGASDAQVMALVDTLKDVMEERAIMALENRNLRKALESSIPIADSYGSISNVTLCPRFEFRRSYWKSNRKKPKNDMAIQLKFVLVQH